MTSTSHDGALRETLPAPPAASTSETWRPPSQRKAPAVSGTFQSAPSLRRPFRKHG
ncbi:MAG TPA: hypothetical protein VHE30_20760 [Polyangiaceae bacterium]|nr:hypothetical protein [Polyangiaceae bacterium]